MPAMPCSKSCEKTMRPSATGPWPAGLGDAGTSARLILSGLAGASAPGAGRSEAAASRAPPPLSEAAASRAPPPAPAEASAPGAGTPGDPSLPASASMALPPPPPAPPRPAPPPEPPLGTPPKPPAPEPPAPAPGSMPPPPPAGGPPLPGGSEAHARPSAARTTAAQRRRIRQLFGVFIFWSCRKAPEVVVRPATTRLLAASDRPPVTHRRSSPSVRASMWRALSQRRRVDGGAAPFAGSTPSLTTRSPPGWSTFSSTGISLPARLWSIS